MTMLTSPIYHMKLRQLLHQVRIRSGLKDIYQNNKHPISDQSLSNYLRMCFDNERTLNEVNKNPEKNPDSKVTDIFTSGTEKMVLTLLKELHYDTPSRFRWGMIQKNIDSESAGEEDEAEE